MIFLVSVIQEKILCFVDGSRLDKYAEVLICRFVYRILPRIYQGESRPRNTKFSPELLEC